MALNKKKKKKLFISQYIVINKAFNIFVFSTSNIFLKIYKILQNLRKIE